MKNINNVVLCGLGSIGCVCAVPIFESIGDKFKILVDEARLKRYKENPTIFNGKEYDFNYITPDETNFKADLVIIATKHDGLKPAIKELKNFVTEDTIIISLLNGIGSEEEIAEVYNAKNIPLSFYIGESGIRQGRSITQCGIYNIVMGAGEHTDKNIMPIISEFFDRTGVHYQIPSNMLEEYWKKFMINVGINQICATEKISLKEVKKDEKLVLKLKNLIGEVKEIAKARGIKNYQKINDEALKFLLVDLEDALPSMLQDVMAKRPTEVDIFAGKIIELGKKYNISTPENLNIYEKITKMQDEYILSKV